MPYLQPKPRANSGWLATQVFYGVDCSDANPENWTEFGEYVAQRDAADATTAAALGPKGAPAKPEPRREP